LPPPGEGSFVPVIGVDEALWPPADDELLELESGVQPTSRRTMTPAGSIANAPLFIPSIATLSTLCAWPVI
jgi:hypothetical protein